MILGFWENLWSGFMLWLRLRRSHQLNFYYDDVLVELVQLGLLLSHLQTPSGELWVVKNKAIRAERFLVHASGYRHQVLVSLPSPLNYKEAHAFFYQLVWSAPFVATDPDFSLTPQSEDRLTWCVDVLLLGADYAKPFDHRLYRLVVDTLSV